MTHETFGASNFAVRLMQATGDDKGDARAAAAASDAMLRKMHAGLIALLGTAGVTMLVGRALRIAQREHSALSAVNLVVEPELTQQGLQQVLETAPNGDPAFLAAAVPQQLINLLISLLGEDVGLVPVRKMWPHVPINPPSPIPAESSNE